jgi:ABC-type branched-subunit amino acid transport system substrate-binding protein
VSALPRKAGSRAVLIGCARYTELADRPSIATGVTDLYSVLTAPATGGFDPEACLVLHDPGNVHDLHEQLVETARDTTDTLLIYYGGHGLLDERNHLHLAVATSRSDKALIPTSALNYEQIRAALRSSPARNKVVILDCCYAGRAIPDLSGSADLAGLGVVYGAYVLAATSPTELALAPAQDRYAAFTGALISLLRTGIPGGPALLTLEVLYPRLRRTLAARSLPEPHQQGTDRVTGLALARNPAVYILRSTGSMVRSTGSDVHIPAPSAPAASSAAPSPGSAQQILDPPGLAVTTAPDSLRISGESPDSLRIAGASPDSLHISGLPPHPDTESAAPQDGEPAGLDGTAAGAEAEHEPVDRAGKGADSTGKTRFPPGRRAMVIGALLLSALSLVIIPIIFPPPPPPPPCSQPASGSLSETWQEADGNCYGYADSGSGFGRDPLAEKLQATVFSQNQPVRQGDLIVVWFGTLSCASYQPDNMCSDHREYDSERQELQGLILAQRRTDLPSRIHVVIANAGADMAHAPQVAQRIAQKLSTAGRVVVIGGGDSREETKKAITTLLDAGIPFIAPTLTADLGAGGRPFVDKQGFLQMSEPNQNFANAAVSFIAAHTPRNKRRKVIVYHLPTPGDEYTESLASDVVDSARNNPRTFVTPGEETISDVNRLPRSVCKTATGDDLPAALFFADRWNTFATFVQKLTTACGFSGPALLISSDSVDRFMTNDTARAALLAPWPLAYYRKGKQCDDLKKNTSAEAATLLDSAQKNLSACSPSAQIGDQVSEFWDAVLLATKTVGKNGGTDLADETLSATTGTFAVRGAQITEYGDPAQVLCVLAIGPGGGRSADNCTTAFGAART